MRLKRFWFCSLLCCKHPKGTGAVSHPPICSAGTTVLIDCGGHVGGQTLHSAVIKMEVIKQILTENNHISDIHRHNLKQTYCNGFGMF